MVLQFEIASPLARRYIYLSQNPMQKAGGVFQFQSILWLLFGLVFRFSFPVRLCRAKVGGCSFKNRAFSTFFACFSVGYLVLRWVGLRVFVFAFGLRASLGANFYFGFVRVFYRR